MSRPILLLFAGLALLGGAVLGYFLHDRALHPERPLFGPAPVVAPAATTARTAATPALAADPAAAFDPPPGAVPHVPRVTIPDTRPDFTLADLEGRRRSIRDWDGRSLIINFWATWCVPCRREIPLLNRLHAELEPRGVTVVGVAVDFRDPVVEFAKDFRIAYPLLLGEEDGLEAAKAFGMASMAFPFTAFTDARGRILAVHVGELHEPQARAILAVVGQVNAGELEPPAARAAIRTALAALPPPASPAARAGADAAR